MPITGGDPRFAAFCNLLEKRIEALESKVENLAKNRPTPAAVEKIVEETVAEQKDEPKPFARHGTFP